VYFVSEFEEILRAWQWPFIMSTVNVPVIAKAAELKEQLGPVCRHLACLHLSYPLLASSLLFTSDENMIIVSFIHVMRCISLRHFAML